MPANIRQDIVERADGIPLFVEEMTKAVLEAEGEGAAARTLASIPVARTRCARQPPRLADGAARPAWAGEGLGADRRGDRAGVFPCAAGCGGADARSGAWLGARSPRRCWFAVPAGYAAACDLFVQTCPCSGRGLWHAAARAPTRASRPHRRSSRRPIRRHRGEPAGAAGASLRRGRPDRAGGASLGEGGTAVAARSAFIEAEAQLRARLPRSHSLPATPALRREQIKFQVALLTPSCMLRATGRQKLKPAAGASVAADRTSRCARGAAGRSLGAVFRPLQLLYREYMAFNGDAMCALATQFLELAEKQRATIPLMIGHRLMGVSSLRGQLREWAERTSIARSDFTSLWNTDHSPLDLVKTSGWRSCPGGR